MRKKPSRLKSSAQSPKRKPAIKRKTPAVSPSLPQGIFKEEELPQTYNISFLGLMAKDPYRIFATWEIAQEDLKRLRTRIKQDADLSRMVLRVYDVTLVDFNGHNANSHFDIEVGDATNWYISLPCDHIWVCAQMGLKTKNGDFFPLVRSNFVETPRARPSPRTEEIWMTVVPSEKSAQEKSRPLTSETYAVSHPVVFLEGAAEGAVPPVIEKKETRKIYLRREDIYRYYAGLMPRLRDLIADRLKALYGKRLHRWQLAGEGKEKKRGVQHLSRSRWQDAWQGASEFWVKERGLLPSQWGASESVHQKIKERQFFFEIWADLIVYGRTQPQAEVHLADQNIPLRPDGTFTLRYALPDGTIPFDFTALSSDRIEKRKIDMEVKRWTRAAQ